MMSRMRRSWCRSCASLSRAPSASASFESSYSSRGWSCASDRESERDRGAGVARARGSRTRRAVPTFAIEIVGLHAIGRFSYLLRLSVLLASSAVVEACRAAGTARRAHMKAERADAPARIDRMAPASSTVNDAARIDLMVQSPARGAGGRISSTPSSSDEPRNWCRRCGARQSLPINDANWFSV